MANTERSRSLLSSAPSRLSDVRGARRAADHNRPREGTPQPGAGAPNPFASFAPPAGGRDASAETKHYVVPRELIEIARARTNGAEPAGATTPLAPRPDAALEATLRAYTAPLSSEPPRAPVVPDHSIAQEAVASGGMVSGERVAVHAAESSTAAASTAAEGMAVREVPVGATARQAVAERPGAAAAEPVLLLQRRPTLRPPRAPYARAAHRAGPSRAWLAYAALSLLGLASCAHVLLGW